MDDETREAPGEMVAYLTLDIDGAYRKAEVRVDVRELADKNLVEEPMLPQLRLVLEYLYKEIREQNPRGR